MLSLQQAISGDEVADNFPLIGATVICPLVLRMKNHNIDQGLPSKCDDTRVYRRVTSPFFNLKLHLLKLSSLCSWRVPYKDYDTLAGYLFESAAEDIQQKEAESQPK